MASIESVVKYFLSLFRLQLEFSEKRTARSSYRLVGRDATGEQVYELQAGCKGDWKSRRMSIRQLGESVASKSTCYKVIYDDLLVVKMPPRSFPDFDTYLTYIQTEKTIARQLTPAIACLYPSIAGVLKKIPQVNPTGRQLLETENDYIRLLIKRPELQTYLKIGGRFAFFMDLSKYSFLNQILTGIHEKTLRTSEAILKHRDAFFYLDAFETIYGSGHDDTFFAVNQLFRHYQNRLDRVVAHTEGLLAIPDYLREEWFFDWMAGRLPDIAANGYSEPVAENIQHALASITQTDQAAIENYKTLVADYVKQKIFHSNQGKMAGLIANTLKLIARLKTQAVAVRDLKPDNIFVAGNFDGADHLLGDPDSYDLGLIDLETAISVDSSRPGGLQQPLMAGTPSFMTPSQLFGNAILEDLFGAETPRVLYMQDWYAAVGIIYNIVTGEHLFHRTAKLIPEIMRLKQKSSKPSAEIFKQVSWNFWNTASMEMAESIRMHADRLDELRVALPSPACEALAAESLQENAFLKEVLHQKIAEQDFFPNSREALSHATPESIRKNRIKQEQRLQSGKCDAVQQNRSLSFLKTLETLKAQAAQNRSLLRLHAGGELSAGAGPTAAELMHILFKRAFYAMYNPLWTERPVPLDAGAMPDTD